MTNQTIKVEGLPEGWKAVEIRVDPDQYNKYIGDDGFMYWKAKIKMEKIQPRRIVLEETEEENPRYTSGLHETQFLANGDVRIHNLKKKWREVKETDIPLNSDEPKLSLSVSEVKTIFGCDFALLVKIEKFIKENS